MQEFQKQHMSYLLKASFSHVSSKRIPPFDCLDAFEHLIIMQQCMKAWPFVQQLLPPSAWQVSLPLIYQLSGTVWGALFWKCARHTFSDWDEYWTLECYILHRVSQFLHVSRITHIPAFLNHGPQSPKPVVSLSAWGVGTCTMRF